MTTTKTQAKAPITSAKPLPFPVPGTGAVVNAQRNQADNSVRVWVEVGGFGEAGWDYVYGDEQVARAEARRAAKAFHAHRSTAGIDRRREQLAMELATEQARARRRMSSPTRIANIQTELDQLMSFGDAHQSRGLTSHLTSSNAA